MKIAILHTWMDNVGGAEKVTLRLAKELNADIYTTNINKKAIGDMGFKDVKIKSIGRVPLNSPFKQQTTFLMFRKLKLKDYDYFIITGDWAMSAAVNNKPSLFYANNAPCRELFDLHDYNKRETFTSIQRPIPYLRDCLNRFLFKRYIKLCGKIIVNSKHVQKEFYKYFNIKSKVITPPVNTKDFKYKKNGDFWLSVSRFSPHKRLNLQLEAFRKLPKEKLIIIGWGEKTTYHKNYLKKLLKPKTENVTLMKSLPRKELIDYYSKCKGIITTTIREDFGLVPIEAMASGKPVIAPNEGGYKETILDGITGKLIEDINVDKLVNAIKEVGKNPKKYKKACLKQAKKFDTKVFITKMKEQMGYGQ